MKKLIMPLVLLSALVIGQSCSPKEEVSNNAETTSIKDEARLVKATNEEIAAKRASIAKAAAEKEDERQLAILERAKATPTYKDAFGNVIYYKAEIDPSYPGGFDELREYLRDNINYPEEARDKGQEATVFVEFIVDAKGKVREVVAADVVGDEAHDLFKAESVRVVSGMPAWNPGRQQGKAVDASFSIPINFQLVN